jgi:tRNA uridine 5-carboxymethylaminomethyl modification enzyme
VPEIYVNGMSSSMPEEVQLEFVRTVRGLERAEMIRPGYAVEYDFVMPHQLMATLEMKGVPGLFLAGQICGTSGYEEAAAQGLVAGVNAARAVRGEEPFVLRRDQAYVGVLDDLVTREHREPYRMFTSAAEHRLLLRAENADERLAEIGFELGLLSRVQLDRVREKLAAIEAEERRLATVIVTMPMAGGAPALARAPADAAEVADAAGAAAPVAAKAPGAAGAADAAVDAKALGAAEAPAAAKARAAAVASVAAKAPVATEPPAAASALAPQAGARTRRASALEFVAQAGLGYAALRELGVETPLPAAWAECLEVRARYRGYIERQQRAAERAAAMDRVALPEAIWAEELRALSREAREKLTRMRPGTLGQAARIAGVSPADVAVLMIHARRMAGAEP